MCEWLRISTENLTWTYELTVRGHKTDGDQIVCHNLRKNFRFGWGFLLFYLFSNFNLCPCFISSTPPPTPNCWKYLSNIFKTLGYEICLRLLTKFISTVDIKTYSYQVYVFTYASVRNFTGLLNVFQLWDFSFFLESFEKYCENLKSPFFCHVYNGILNMSSEILGSYRTSEVLFRNVIKIYVIAWITILNSESAEINVYCVAS